MFNPLLVLRQRFRHLARKRGAAVSQAVGNRPFLTGIAGTLIATAMAGLTLATLYSGRTDALNHARETSANLVSLISSDLARNVEIYNLSLQEIVHRSQEPTVWHLPDDLRRTVLFDRATLAAYLGGAYVVDEHGVLKATQEGAVNKNVRFDDRDYFVVHQRNPNAGLFVSHPYRSRLREHELSFALSRRIDARDGSFAGVALLAVRIAYLQRLLDKVNKAATAPRSSCTKTARCSRASRTPKPPSASMSIGIRNMRSRTRERRDRSLTNLPSIMCGASTRTRMCPTRRSS